MTETEYQDLVRHINEMGLTSGKVLKANGQWYIEGKAEEVARPVIKLPHWTEGKGVKVIECRRSNENESGDNTGCVFTVLP